MYWSISIFGYIVYWSLRVVHDIRFFTYRVRERAEERDVDSQGGGSVKGLEEEKVFGRIKLSLIEICDFTPKSLADSPTRITSVSTSMT